MDIVKLGIGQVLPYITIAVLLFGLAARLARWSRAPVGKMTIFPGSTTGGEMVKEIAKEVLVFRSLFAGNKALWAGSWVFHAMLALIAMGHIRVIWEPMFAWNLMGVDRSGIHFISGATGGTFGVVVLLACCYLFIRRLAVVRVREISDVEDYAALLLIIAIVVTGNAMRFAIPAAEGHAIIEGATGTRAYFLALLTFKNAAAVMPANPWFIAHFLLSQVLFIYMPFSKFLHIPGVFYSHALIQKA